MDGKGVEWLDEGLPIPNYLEHSNRGYFIGWQIDGFFATQKGVEFLNDIVGRITIGLSDCKPNRLPWKPEMSEELAHYYPKIHKLLAFRGIASLTKKTNAPTRADALGGKDYCFWAIKLYTEDAIRQFGEGTPVPYQIIEDWAYNQFSGHKKGLSTVRAKVRSVWNWNDKRDWELPKNYIKKDAKEVLMTRRERALKNSEARQEEARKLIIDATSGLMSPEYKKKSGAWHLGKIANATRLSTKTVSKHLKELKLIA